MTQRWGDSLADRRNLDRWLTGEGRWFGDEPPDVEYADDLNDYPIEEES